MENLLAITFLDKIMKDNTNWAQGYLVDLAYLSIT